MQERQRYYDGANADHRVAAAFHPTHWSPDRHPALDAGGRAALIDHDVNVVSIGTKRSGIDEKEVSQAAPPYFLRPEYAHRQIQLSAGSTYVMLAMPHCLLYMMAGHCEPTR